jgi:hypothetical protein
MKSWPSTAGNDQKISGLHLCVATSPPCSALAAFGIAWQRQMHDLQVSIGATLMTGISLTYESDVTARSDMVRYETWNDDRVGGNVRRRAAWMKSDRRDACAAETTS